MLTSVRASTSSLKRRSHEWWRTYSPIWVTFTTGRDTALIGTLGPGGSLQDPFGRKLGTSTLLAVQMKEVDKRLADLSGSGLSEVALAFAINASRISRAAERDLFDVRFPDASTIQPRL